MRLVALTGAPAALAVQGVERAIDLLAGGVFRALPAWLAGRGLPAGGAYLLFPAAAGLLVHLCRRRVAAADRLPASAGCCPRPWGPATAW